MRENEYQRKLKEKLIKRFPGSIVVKMDPGAGIPQGFPDLFIFFGRCWAALEVKATKKSNKRPNQGYWVTLLDRMSFARFIFPENEEEVLNELEQSFKRRP